MLMNQNVPKSFYRLLFINITMQIYQNHSTIYIISASNIFIHHIYSAIVNEQADSVFRGRRENKYPWANKDLAQTETRRQQFGNESLLTALANLNLPA